MTLGREPTRRRAQHLLGHGRPPCPQRTEPSGRRRVVPERELPSPECAARAAVTVANHGVGDGRGGNYEGARGCDQQGKEAPG